MISDSESQMSSEMHLPGYFSLRDINNSTRNACQTLLHCQERNPGQYRDLFTGRSSGDFEPPKDQLRQTMLEHEMVFQHQLHELHRLYNAQCHMMNDIIRSEKRPETSLGGFTSCLSSEDRRNEWLCPVSNYVQSMARFKIGDRFDGSTCDQIRRRLYDVDVPAHRYSVGYDGVLEIPADTLKYSAMNQGKGTGDACSSRLHSLRKGRMIDLNESFPSDEPSVQQQNMPVGTSSSFGGSFPGHGEHGKQISNTSESCGKKRIFGVDISEKSPSKKNGCFKLLGFTVLENQQEPRDLHSLSSSTSKSSPRASVLFSAMKSSGKDHMLVRPEEKRSANSFSSSPASVLSYSGNSGNAESFKSDHLIQKPPSVNAFSSSKLLIDLNSCAEESEEELRLEPSSPGDRSTRMDIDLEAPACPDTENSASEDEFSGNRASIEGEDATAVAAEALLYISSSSGVEDSPIDLDPLRSLIDAISSQELGLASSEIADSEVSIPEELDYFEYMTLKLPETETVVEEPEDVSRVCEIPRAQSVDRKLPRRGQRRRGRRPHKKDFQRDVLPTLASLSRNEAVDDLHVIGDLIRDIGGNPESGSCRGRERPVNGLEEEKKGLVVWGKRTRRPPRQRCNPYPVI